MSGGIETNTITWKVTDHCSGRTFIFYHSPYI